MTITVQRWDSTASAWCNVAMETMTFPGGEPHAKPPDDHDVRGGTYLIDARIESFNTLGMALVVNDLLKRSGASAIHLFCPYLPAARQDRGAPLTAALVATLINQADFETVTCVDPHSDVMPSLIDRLCTINSDQIFPAGLFPAPDQAVLVCPDNGATHRVEMVAQAHGFDVVYAGKHRNPHTGSLTGFHCEPIPAGKVGIVCDDICDGGGTFLGLAAVFPESTELMLWTSHAMFSKGLEALAARYTVIATTDSFPHGHRSICLRDLQAVSETLNALTATSRCPTTSQKRITL